MCLPNVPSEWLPLTYAVTYCALAFSLLYALLREFPKDK